MNNPPVIKKKGSLNNVTHGAAGKKTNVMRGKDKTSQIGFFFITRSNTPAKIKNNGKAKKINKAVSKILIPMN